MKLPRDLITRPIKALKRMPPPARIDNRQPPGLALGHRGQMLGDIDERRGRHGANLLIEANPRPVRSRPNRMAHRGNTSRGDGLMAKKKRTPGRQPNHRPEPPAGLPGPRVAERLLRQFVAGLPNDAPDTPLA